ncbi:TlpA family protein disulfide reductase [Mucilaginibacter sp.]
MKKITIYIVLGMLCLFFNVQAQETPGYQGLQPGDKVPDLVIKNISRYTGDSVRLHGFGNKLLILDFWATSCGSCIEMFPEDIALQNRYKDSIQFLLVNSSNTRDTKTRVARFFVVHQAYTQLPSIVEDTLLFSLFPHQADPHYVWIKNNRVMAITGAADVNEKNINAILKGVNLQLSEKTDRYTAYDVQRPLFIAGNGGNATRYLYRSILTPYRADLKASIYFVRDSNKMISGYRFLNQSKRNLFLFTYPQYGDVSENRMIFRVAHPDDFSEDSISESWKSKNEFIYEAAFPATTKSHALEIMRSDMQHFFPISLDSEYREASCLVISGGRKTRGIPVHQKQEVLTFETENFIRNHQLEDLVSYINTKSQLPVIDNSGFTGTIRMNAEISDLSANEVLELLKKEGFTISRQTRRLCFLVLSENPDH